jgi:hypothetical protein
MEIKANGIRKVEKVCNVCVCVCVCVCVYPPQYIVLLLVFRGKKNETNRQDKNEEPPHT